MIRFHIPDFYLFNKMNLKLISLIDEFRSCFYDGVTIGSIFGTFPNAIWNGGRVISDKSFDETCIPNYIHSFNKKVYH